MYFADVDEADDKFDNASSSVLKLPRTERKTANAL